MTLGQLVKFVTGDRDEDDPDQGIALGFEIKLSPDYRGKPYPLEVASIDYVSKEIWLY